MLSIHYIEAVRTIKKYSFLKIFKLIKHKNCFQLGVIFRIYTIHIDYYKIRRNLDIRKSDNFSKLIYTNNIYTNITKYIQIINKSNNK